MSIEWRFDLYRAEILVATKLPVLKADIGFERNNFIDGMFIVNGNSLSNEETNNLIEGSRIYVYFKGEEDEELRLIQIQEIKDPQINNTNKNEKTYTVICEHIGNVFLKNRYITKTYISEEEEDIAWDIINTIQTDTKSGAFTLDQVDWGITQGILEVTTNTRDRTYIKDEALKALKQLSNLLDVSPNPQRLRGFRLYPDLLNDSIFVFDYFAEYGQNRNITLGNTDILNIDITSSFQTYKNRIIGVGQTSTTDQIANSTNTDDLNLYRMRETIFNSFNSQTNANLLDETEQELERLETIVKIYTINLIDNLQYIGQFRCGDSLRIIYNNNNLDINIDDTFIVFGIFLSIDEKNNTKIKMNIAENNIEISNFFDPTKKLINKINLNNKQLTDLGK